jgi:hypothetical protein
MKMMYAQAFNILPRSGKTIPYSGYVLKPNTRTNREQSKGKHDLRPVHRERLSRAACAALAIAGAAFSAAFL